MSARLTADVAYRTVVRLTALERWLEHLAADWTAPYSIRRHALTVAAAVCQWRSRLVFGLDAAPDAVRALSLLRALDTLLSASRS